MAINTIGGYLIVRTMSPEARLAECHALFPVSRQEQERETTALRKALKANSGTAPATQAERPAEDRGRWEPPHGETEDDLPF